MYEQKPGNISKKSRTTKSRYQLMPACLDIIITCTAEIKANEKLFKVEWNNINLAIDFSCFYQLAMP